MTGSLLDKYASLSKADQNRDPKHLASDRAAVDAIAQAAVNVELFTIPLYMVSMYSIQGLHEITGDNAFYEGRLWPGRATVVEPHAKDSKALAFNLIFKVFIEEMLHLQLAANLYETVAIDPSQLSFTQLSPPSAGYAWSCYADQSTIPHILDFRDAKPEFSDIVVKLSAMNQSQIRLFLAIEETADRAHHVIRPECLDKYFPDVPFEGYRPGDPLPMFGSIGAMYLSLWKYLNLRYSDGTTLWQHVQAGRKGLQRDLFNARSASHPKEEYPGFVAQVDATDDSREALHEVMRIINAITDQGEGKGVAPRMRQLAGLPAVPTLTVVEKQYRADYSALKADYRAYDGKGKPLPVSGDAFARGTQPNVELDHFEVFEKVRDLIAQPDFETWDAWHANPRNRWTEQMLQPDPKVNSSYDIPPAAAVADALNRLKSDDGGAHYQRLSHAATGAIAGITRVLDDYWQQEDVAFPYPSMSGSGDRVSICWAVFGRPPALTEPIAKRDAAILNHACQGLALDPARRDPASCAPVPIYHTCKGSNQCKAEGGCGFVHSVSGGGNCSQSAKVGFQASCGQCGSNSGGAPYSAPADNRCGGLGGCAVPISASQLYPAPADGVTTMNVYDFVGPGDEPQQIGQIEYSAGEAVYDVAWRAYQEVLRHRKVEPLPDKPDPSIYRLAFPPST
jgi:hypothetical protein